MTAYQTLGVHRESTDEAIHDAWRKIVSENHPDKFPERAAQAAKVNEARALIKTKDRRRTYNDLLDVTYEHCLRCGGKGVTKKQKGMIKIATRCERCGGSGVVV